MAQRLKCLPGTQETQVQSLGREDPLEKEMATYASILAWEIPWAEEPDGLYKVQFSSVAQSCSTLCQPTDCSPPGSSVHGILQAGTLEWVAISFSRGSSRPRD